jgi:type I restriction enzyme R subunit
MPKPEEKARQEIDKQLTQSGWAVQERDKANLSAAQGVAVGEFPLTSGFADYMLFVDSRPIGVVEAKPAGTTLTGVEPQTAQYSEGLPDSLAGNAWHTPLPFLYQSTGVETFFTDLRDPEPRSRRVFSFHRPETLAEWADQRDTLRSRLRRLPPLITTGLWPGQIRAVEGLEGSLAADQPRSLIQMATGSGKTYTAVTFAYRLIKHAKAHRILFMVDRTNLGIQALREFQQFVTPDDGRKFGELYNVQLMTSNALDPVSKVCITTVQRLYSMLRGEAEFDPSLEEHSMGYLSKVFGDQAREVAYSDYLPPETFDFIVIDECHRSIYNVWRQVLEYFDAYLIGLTATPSKQTFGFFKSNLVMEYPRDRAVADGVNVDGWVYRIRTEVTEQGATVDAGEYVGKRSRATREVRWEQLDEDLAYDPSQLDRDVITPDQIRTVIRAFRDRLFTDIFPGRTEVPKTLVFAKDDSHADDIVRIIREEFGKGNEFCQKVTYRTEGKVEEVIKAFRNSYNPRIAVTVDMIATGTDVKPIEILLFMRRVQSANYFEQMIGRGTRVIDETDLRAVTPDTTSKDHFVIVDAVGVVDHPKVDVGTLDRKRSLPLDKLLEAVAFRAFDEEMLSSLAVRLSRLEDELSDAEHEQVAALTNGGSVRTLTHALLDALDPDRAADLAREQASGADPTAEQIESARKELVATAVAPFDEPKLRKLLPAIKARSEQVIDDVTRDRLREAGYAVEETERARETVASFYRFIQEHKDEIDALQIIFSQPYGKRKLNYEQVKELAERIAQPPNMWTTEGLWNAYARLEKDSVRGVAAKRVLTDVVSLVRHAVQLEDELVPYPDLVRRRYRDWLAAQVVEEREFTEQQRWWLDRIAEVVGVNLSVTSDDFQAGELFERGGWVAAKKLFGGQVLPALVDELNEVLTA